MEEKIIDIIIEFLSEFEYTLYKNLVKKANFEPLTKGTFLSKLLIDFLEYKKFKYRNQIFIPSIKGVKMKDCKKILLISIGSRDDIASILTNTLNYCYIICKDIINSIIFHAVKWDTYTWLNFSDLIINKNLKIILKIFFIKPYIKIL